MADLTGKWSCDDKGMYYVRQLGNMVYWYGEKAWTDPDWSNVFVGYINNDVVTGNWADVPKGKNELSGEMRFRISPNGNSFDCIHKTGGFGGSHWTRNV